MEALNILPPIIILIFGVLFGLRFKSLDRRPFSLVTIYVLTPALFLSAFPRPSDISDYLPLLLYPASQMILFFVYLILTRALPLARRKKILLQIMLPNAGNMGLAIIYFAFGQEGLETGMIGMIYSMFLSASLGITLTHPSSMKHGFKEIFRVPMIYAFVVAAIIVISDFEIPMMIQGALALTGFAAIPLNLILLGMEMTGIKKGVGRGIFSWVWPGRIFLSPLLYFVLISLFSEWTFLSKILLLHAAMPPAVYSIILARRHGEKPADLVSSLVLCTLISLITLPVLLYLLPRLR